MSLLQLLVLRLNFESIPSASPTTSRCPGKPRRAPPPTWPWLRTQRVAGGHVTAAAPAARYLGWPAGSSTRSTPLAWMKSAWEQGATWRSFKQVAFRCHGNKKEDFSDRFCSLTTSTKRFKKVLMSSSLQRFRSRRDRGGQGAREGGGRGGG